MRPGNIDSIACSTISLRTNQFNSNHAPVTLNQTSNFQSLYIFLKAQLSIIKNIMAKIPLSPLPQEKRVFSTIRLNILRLTSCNYSELFQRLNNTITSLQTILSDTKNTKRVEKFAQQLLTSAMALNRIIISNSIRKNAHEDDNPISSQNQNFSNALKSSDDNLILDFQPLQNQTDQNLIQISKPEINVLNDSLNDSLNDRFGNFDVQISESSSTSMKIRSKTDIPYPKSVPHPPIELNSISSFHNSPFKHDDDFSDQFFSTNIFDDAQSLGNRTLAMANIDFDDVMTRPRSMIRSSSKPHFNDSHWSSDSQEFVVCRICDEKIPADSIEKHTILCVRAYTNASLVSEINDKLQQLHDEISAKYLEMPWPGSSDVVIPIVLPLFIVNLMAENVIAIDINNEDSIDELISSNFVFSKTKGLNQEVVNELQKFRSLVYKKLCTAKARKINDERLRNSGMSGNSIKTRQALISDFTFIKRISAGAYAKVFLARKHATGDIYAIKVIPKKSLTEKNQVKRLYAEKDLLLRFSNPYIVSFYYSIIGKNNLYLVMEYLPGGDLYSLLQNLGSLDESTAKLYILQIVHALKYLRQNGIIHRDLKPDNILISKSGKLKLTDFGLSFIGMVNRQIPIDDQIIESNSLVGTPDYIAPEILLARPHTFTCDLWSLGVIIFELLCGVPPFHSNSENQTRQNIVSGRWPKEEAVEQYELSNEAIDLISRLLRINPQERIGAKDIDEILQHPWLQGVDINQKAPFVPELNSDEDTDYFLCRYNFNEVDDHDIIDDIKYDELRFLEGGTGRSSFHNGFGNQRKSSKHFSVDLTGSMSDKDFQLAMDNFGNDNISNDDVVDHMNKMVEEQKQMMEKQRAEMESLAARNFAYNPTESLKQFESMSIKTLAEQNIRLSESYKRRKNIDMLKMHRMDQNEMFEQSSTKMRKDQKPGSCSTIERTNFIFDALESDDFSTNDLNSD